MNNTYDSLTDPIKHENIKLPCEKVLILKNFSRQVHFHKGIPDASRDNRAKPRLSSKENELVSPHHCSLWESLHEKPF